MDETLSKKPETETTEINDSANKNDVTSEEHENHHHHHHHSESHSDDGSSEHRHHHHHSERSDTKKHKKKKKKDNKKGIAAYIKKMNKTGKQALLFILGILLCTIIIFGVVFWSNKIVENRDKEKTEKTAYGGNPTEEIYIDGVAYLPKNNISSFLIIGIDKSGRFKEVDSYINDQQCDFLALVVFDSDAKTYRIIHINRDTMTPVNMLGVRGEVVSTRMMQIALSHTYGNGLERSCVNTLEAVSNLMYGINIEKYFAITMSGVSEIADYAGGVPVTIEEDLTALDPSFTEGAEVVLNGDKALSFVRARQSVSDGTNIARMGRQKQFIKSLMEIFEAEEDTEEFVYGAMKRVANYSISNIETKDIETIAESFDEYTFDGIISPEGEAVFDGEYMRFNVDDEKLKELVLETFYNKAEED